MIQQNLNHLLDGLRSFLPCCDLKQAQLDVFDAFLSQADEPHFAKGFFDLATGFGKTRMMNVLAESLLSQNLNAKIVIVVPTQGLIRDENGEGMIKWFNDFHQMYFSEPLSIGAFYAYEKSTNQQIIVTTYTSLNRLVKKINPKEVSLLLLDEAHHSLTQKRIGAIKEFSNACCYGLTATPAYSPDKNLEKLLGSVIAEIKTVQAIEDGILAPCKNILLSSKIKVDLANVSKNNQGEYDEKDFDEALETALLAYKADGNAQNWQNVHELVAYEIAHFYKDYIDETIGKVQGKKCMINCRTQEEARLQVRALNNLFGKIIARDWTSDTKDKSILDSFVNGDLPIVCQVGKLAEGFDMPSLDMCINYPTCSSVLEIQRSGRVLRLNPQNENKLALVVDVVFSHPDFDNPILSSHANGQVLYRDITKKSVMLKRGENKAVLSLEKLDAKGYSDEPLLENFDVYSTVEELMILEHEANECLSYQHIPQKRVGMLTSLDLSMKYSKEVAFFQRMLEKYYQENQTVTTEGGICPLVEKVRSYTHICFALSEHKNALDIFKELLKSEGVNLDISIKREGMMSSFDLAKKYNRRSDFFVKILKKYYQENQTFTIENHNYPLVEEVKTGSNICFALHEHENAFNTLKELLKTDGVFLEERKRAPLRREGMMTSTDLADKYNRRSDFFVKMLKKYYQENQTFTVGGVVFPLVERVKSYSNICLALHENEKAFDVFKKLLKREGFFLEERKNIPQKREGMLTSADLSKKYMKEISFFQKMLKKYYQENQTIIIDGQMYPLVERVKSCSHICFALHENEKAFDVFKKLLKSEGIVLAERKNIPLKREGMLTSDELSKKYNRKSNLFAKILEKYYQENQTFIGDAQIYPLVEKVKSHVTVCYALHEHENALKIFNELLQKEGISLDIPLKREGMLTSGDLLKKYGKRSDFFAKMLKKYHQENHTFILENQVYSLVEEVRAGSNVCLALNEHPMAFVLFKKLLKMDGVDLESQKVISQSKTFLRANSRQKS